MIQKRATDLWVVATTHLITAAFAIPLAIGGFYLFVITPLLGLDSHTPQFVAISATVSVLAIWAGATYSSRVVKHLYYIQDPKRVAAFATRFFTVFTLLFLLGDVISFLNADLAELAGIDIIGAMIGVLVFYFVSIRELS